MTEKKPSPADSAGAESGQPVGPYGTAATWSLASLPGLMLRITADHPAFFAVVVAADATFSLVPSNTSFLSLFVTVMVISATLRAIDRTGPVDWGEIWSPIQTRLGTLVGAQIVAMIGLGLIGVALWFLVAQADFIRFGGPDTVLWGLLLGPPVAFLLSLPFFLAVAVLDGEAGAFASLGHAVRLYLGYLPGNLVIVVGTFGLMLGGVFGLAMVIPDPVGMVLGTLWGSVMGVLANVLATLRWRQLKAWESAA